MRRVHLPGAETHQSHGKFQHSRTATDHQKPPPRFFRPRPSRPRGSFRLVVNQLYYGSTEPTAQRSTARRGFPTSPLAQSQHAPDPTETAVTISPDIIAAALRNIYRRHFRPTTEIEPNLFNAIAATLTQAITAAVPSASPLGQDPLLQALRHSTDVFAAFKVHRAQNDMAARLLDSNGNLKPFEQWRNEVLPIASHQCGPWLETEYNTAVLRARQAANWQQFLREKDILPNLKWLPSTSPNPGEDHRPFWNTILPVDHPFWDHHRPGDRWNCKCDLTSTDAPPTSVPATVPDASPSGNNPQPGLTDNPGKTQAVFSDDHPYFPTDCRHCPFYNPTLKARLATVITARVKDCNHCPYVDGCIDKATAPVTPKTNKELFRFLQEEARETMSDHTPLNLVDKRFYTSRIIYTNDDVDAILWHAFDDDELNAAQQLHLLIPKLKDGKYLPIDMSRKNYKRKIKEGVRHFVLYEVTIDETLYELKCEAVRNDHHRMEERPYSLKKRKTE